MSMSLVAPFASQEFVACRSHPKHEAAPQGLIVVTTLFRASHAAVCGSDFAMLTRYARSSMSMATIGILPLPEPGHVNATRTLFAELSALGHEVRYLSPPAQSDVFIQRGLPTSALRPLDRAGSEPDSASWQLEDEGRKYDLLLVDSIMPAVTMRAWHSGHRVIQFSTTYPRGHERDLPPITSPLSPGAGPDDEAHIRAAWRCERQRPLHQQQTRLLRGHAEAVGLPLNWLDEHAALSATVRAPELVLAPEELDFPRPGTDPPFYAGPCVDIDRAEPALPSPALAADKPLVYCSLGTQLKRYRAVQQLLTLLVQSARLLPELLFVIASDVAVATQLPANVLVLRHAPQLTLLRRAAVMVSHGGLNSIKEALCLGVPLLVLPIDMDQPGNAARVAYRGLGVADTWFQLSPLGLAQRLKTMLQDEGMKLRVRRAAAALRAKLATGQASAALARCLASEAAAAWFRCVPSRADNHGLATLASIASTRPSASGRAGSV
jgi:zeaxanthin glucosyltransferase